MNDWVKIYSNYLALHKGNVRRATGDVVALLMCEEKITESAATHRLNHILEDDKIEAAKKLEAFGGDVMQAEEARMYRRRRSE